MNISLSPEAVPFPMATTSTEYFSISRFTTLFASSILSWGLVG